MMMMFGIIPFFFIAVISFSVFRAFGGAGSTSNYTQKIAGFGERARSILSPRHVDGAIFRLARRSGGRLTLSEVVIETGMDIKSAEKHMDALSDGTHVTVDVDGAGRLFYLFPEIVELIDGTSIN